MSATSTRPVRFLALGDSFTAGTGSKPAEAFPVRLAARFERSGVAVTTLNLGVNGYTTEDLIARELPQVKAFAPTLVTLAIGANDLVHGSNVEHYRAELRLIFAGLGEAGVAAKDVIALPQPDWSLSPVGKRFGDPSAIHASIVQFNGVLKGEADKAGASYVDLFPRMETQAKAQMIAGDGLHPSAAAYDAWAEDLALALDSRVRSR